MLPFPTPQELKTNQLGKKKYQNREICYTFVRSRRIVAEFIELDIVLTRDKIKTSLLQQNFVTATEVAGVFIRIR